MKEQMKKLVLVFSLMAACGLMQGCSGGKKTFDGELEAEIIVEEATQLETMETDTTVVSKEWATFVLEGKSYQMPFAWKELKAEGWAIRGDSAGNVLNPGEHEAAIIQQESKDMIASRATLSVTFTNNGEEPLPVEECDVSSFMMDISMADSYPEMNMENGLAFGDSMSEVEEVYGSCEDITEYEGTGLTRYVYDMDGTGYIIIVFKEGQGIVSFELKGR